MNDEESLLEEVEGVNRRLGGVIGEIEGLRTELNKYVHETYFTFLIVCALIVIELAVVIWLLWN